MTWNSWLLTLQRPTRPIRRSRPQLKLETLEDRTVPAVQVLSTAVPVPSTGAIMANGQSELSPEHAISDNGRFTVYASTATNLVANQVAPTNVTLNIYLYDNNNGSTTLITHESGSSTTALATPANGDSFNAVISGDGSTVVFYSMATNLSGASVTSSTVQLYAYNVSSGNLTLISHEFGNDTVGADGANPAITPLSQQTTSTAAPYYNTIAYSAGSASGLGSDIMGMALPSVSTNGQYIAYISDADNLEASSTAGENTTQNYTNVFLYDANSSDGAFDTNTLVSAASGSATTSAKGFASTVAISGDGSTVAFTDPANNLVSSSSNTGKNDQLYVWSRISDSNTGLSAGQIVLASHAAGNATAGATIPTSLQGGTIAQLFGFTGWTADTPPSLSNDGTAVAYYDAGNNLVASQGGTPSVLNVFRYDVKNNVNALVSHVANDTATAGNNPQNQVAPVDLGPVEASGPAISKDGRYIAFANNSANLLSTSDTFTTGGKTYNGADNVYLYDNNNPNTLTLVSHAQGSATTPLSNGGTAPSMSSDGRYVSFVDWALPATGSVTGTTGGIDVLLFDSQASSSSSPTFIGHAVNPSTSDSIGSSILVPTILSADGSALTWDGDSSATVNGVAPDTTNKTPLNVFLYTNSSSSSFTITSSGSASFTVGSSSSFTLTTSSTATSFTESGSLPSGLTFNTSSGTLSGTPGANTGGSYSLTFTASNGSSSTTQNFNLVVDQTPAITSTPSVTFNAGSSSSFTVTTTGYPSPTFTETGTLPSGLTFNTTTGTLSGTPGSSSGSSYAVTFTAGNGVGTNATQNFTIIVDQTPSITSSASTTFAVGTAETFTLTATGYPTPTTFTESGTLPSGLTFNAAAGTLSGTPGTNTGGSYPLTFTASNGSATATQNFTLVVDQTPVITSSASVTYTAGTAETFTLTTTGFPAPTLTESGTLPGGLTFSNGVLSGTPNASTGGSYSLTFTAANGSATTTQNFTLVVDQAPAITSSASVTFTAGTAGTFTPATTGYPTPTTFSETGALPSGVSFNTSTGALSGTPGANSGGSYALTLTAGNGVGTNASQSFTLIVDQTPAITSSATTTFTVGSAGTFTPTTTGYPAPTTFSETGTLPSGVSFNTSTGTLSGTPAAGVGGSYALTLTASNGIGTAASQNFTLVVDQAPAITSSASTTFTIGGSSSFTLTTTGYPTPTTFGETGTLPSGVTFNTATGMLSGTPGTGTGGSYPLTLTASNGVGTAASQNFTLLVSQSPNITSSASTTFTVGSSSSFTMTATGDPAPTSFSESGTLPSGVTFNNGVLSGTPAANTGGLYPLTLTASNGVGTNASQNFSLIVDQAPAITSSASVTFTAGTAGTFTPTTTGYPTPTTFSETGALPSGVSFNTSTGALSGTPGANSGGSYALTLTAGNGVGTNASQSFTLIVDQAPAITSSATTTFTVGSAGTFTPTTTGYPAPTTFSEAGTLPTGLSFDTTTGAISGTPSANTGGSYALTLTASNGVGANASQNFTLIVDQAPAITSTGSATFTVGTAGTFTPTTTGYPAPTTFSETGTLPNGVSFNTATGALSGTPAANTGGPYALTLTASNGIGTAATQNFTLYVDQAPAITSTGSTTFTVGTAGSLTVTTTGYPNPTITESGTLPGGVTINNGVLSGRPNANAGGVYNISLNANNAVGSVSQAFTLTVDEASIGTSSTSTTFMAGTAGSFTVPTTGYPAPTSFTESGALPSGITFNSATGTLSGTPSTTSGGLYPITITASNGFGTSTTTLALAVDQTPAISSTSATFSTGNSSMFNLTTTGYPAPTFMLTGTLPNGVTFNSTTGTLSGTPTTGSAGVYTFQITATNAGGSSASQSFTLLILAGLNFTPGPDVTSSESSDPSPSVQTVTNWATNISAGPSPQFVVSNDNNALFATQPAIDANGTLTYQPAQFANGAAQVTVYLTDSTGRTPFGPVVFEITIGPVNQAPSFTAGSDQTAAAVDSPNSVAYSVADWATNISAGPSNESSQTVQFVVSNDSNSLFTIQPTIDANGTLTYLTAPHANGTANVTVYLQDNGGTANGGHDTSAPVTFTINVESLLATPSTNTVQVAQAYQNLLGRPIMANEVDYWNAQFASGVTVLQAAQQITNSQEFLTNYGNTLYQTYLGRPMDPTGQTYVLNLFAQGNTAEQVKAAILSSNEYLQKHGGTIDGFLNGLAHDVLGTPTMDPTLAANLKAQLAGGASFNTIALEVVQSPAAMNLVVQQAYTQLLNRPADPASIQYWSNLLQAGMTDQNFYAAIVASPEYSGNAYTQLYNSGPDTKWLNQVFLDTLNRPINPDEVPYFTNQLQAGTARSTIVEEVLNSPEYQADTVTAEFQAILHRNPDPNSVAYFTNFYSQGETTLQIEAKMYGSPEYYAVEGGGTNEGFLTALFQDVDHRPLNDTDRAYWEPLLASGAVTDEQVADAVLDSPEADQVLVQAAFQKYLRPATSDDVTYWVNQLQGGMTVEQFYGKLLSSPEYYAAFSISSVALATG